MTLPRLAGLWVHKADQLGIVLGINLAGDIHVLTQLGLPIAILSAIDSVFPSRVVPGCRSEGAVQSIKMLFSARMSNPPWE